MGRFAFFMSPPLCALNENPALKHSFQTIGLPLLILLIFLEARSLEPAAKRLDDRLAVVEPLVDPDVFGDHVAEAVLLPGFAHDTPHLLFPDSRRAAGEMSRSSRGRTRAPGHRNPGRGIRSPRPAARRPPSTAIPGSCRGTPPYRGSLPSHRRGCLPGRSVRRVRREKPRTRRRRLRTQEARAPR